MRDKLFYAICFGFIFGVLLRSFVFVNVYSVLFVGFLAFFVSLFFSFVSKNQCLPAGRQGVVVCMFFVFFSVGIFRFHAVDVPPPKVFEEKVGEKKVFVGILIDEADSREENQKLNLKLSEQGEETEVLVTVGLGSEFVYGDKIKVEGKLAKPENFETDTGKTFDYINYLRKDGIYYVMSYPKIEVLSSGHGNFLREILFKIKNAFLESIGRSVAPPESTLMGGLILGERSSFDSDLRQEFIDTGTIHIVALSGYNVTIVAEWFMKLLKSFPERIGISAGIIAVFLFVIMSGANSTAIRAGIMATLALIARATGRNYDVGRALILTGVVMIIFNPFTLAFDVSFQLSFIATVAVIFLTPRVEKHFTWVTKRFGLQDIVSVTFSAYIFVLPFILYKMGNLSLVALPANVLVLPFLPLTMLFGFVTGLVGILWYTLSVPFGILSTLLLKYELGVVHLFSSFSFASFAIPNFPLIVTILIYIYFIYYLFWGSIKQFFSEI